MQSQNYAHMIRLDIIGGTYHEYCSEPHWEEIYGSGFRAAHALSGFGLELHFHTYAEQFFYILKGQATFLIEGETTIVNANTGLQIKAGDKHKISNETDQDLEFILFSYPSTQNDRTDCE